MCQLWAMTRLSQIFLLGPTKNVDREMMNKHHQLFVSQTDPTQRLSSTEKVCSFSERLFRFFRDVKTQETPLFYGRLLIVLE